MPTLSHDTQTPAPSHDATRAPELTRSGPVYTPAVDIFENEHALTVLADLPGVTRDRLEIDLRDSVLTLVGRIAPGPEGRTSVLQEYRAGTFFRQFTVSDVIDQARIDARLDNGVLRLKLPKVEKARPRQITVHAG